MNRDFVEELRQLKAESNGEGPTPPPNLTSHLKSAPVGGRLEVPASEYEISGAELLAEEGGDDIPYLPFLGQEGFTVRGWATLLSAYPKSGKTELLVRVVREWLQAGTDVLWITEEPKLVWKLRLRALAGDWSRLRLLFGIGILPDHLLTRTQRGTEQVVVLDTVRNLLAITNENDNSEVARVVTPWIAATRATDKTFIATHHQRKSAGEYGEAIAGAGALLGVFDVAIEMVRDRHKDNRRLLRTQGRLIASREVIEEMDPETREVAILGDAQKLSMGEVIDRAKDQLTDEWLTTTQIRGALDEPKPGSETLRKALGKLAERGDAERDPDITLDAAGKTVKWRLATQLKRCPDGHLCSLTTPNGSAFCCGEPEENQQRVR